MVWQTELPLKYSRVTAHRSFKQYTVVKCLSESVRRVRKREGPGTIPQLAFRSGGFDKTGEGEGGHFLIICDYPILNKFMI